MKTYREFVGILEGVSGTKWYHGTPDVREVLDNGFTPQTTTTTVIKDLKSYKVLSDKLETVEWNSKEYHTLLDKIASTKENVSRPKAIFFTDSRHAASTYADYNRAFDIQRSVPAILTVSLDVDRTLVINGRGQRFRNIPRSPILAALSEEEREVAETFIETNLFHTREPTISSDDISDLCHSLGYDSYCIENVIDDYNANGSPITVMAVLDPSLINITDVYEVPFD